jgi:predicted protein tyrosine phosphatase
MELLIADRHIAAKVLPIKKFDCIITINDPPDQEVSTPIFSKGRHHLFMEFYDAPIPIPDFQMKRFIQHISNYVKPDSKILIHCYSGISRSSSLAWILLVNIGMDYKEAWKLIKKLRPQSHPKPWFIKGFTEALNLPEFLTYAEEIHYEIQSSTDLANWI